MIFFEQTPQGHLSGRGCRKCLNHKKENLWLDSFNISEEFRQYKIDRMTVDGYDKTCNTVYEFYGDFWHGNPNRYDKTTINNVVKKTFGYLYENTMKREQKLKSLGYNVVTIWETDWDILQKENE